jgi:hypothetical protein
MNVGNAFFVLIKSQIGALQPYPTDCFPWLGYTLNYRWQIPVNLNFFDRQLWLAILASDGKAFDGQSRPDVSFAWPNGNRPPEQVGDLLR